MRVYRVSVVEEYRVDFDFEKGEPFWYSAAVNMALDEYILERSAETGEAFLRVYGFEKPAFVPSRHTSVEEIDSAVSNGYDFTRRETNGSTIPCLENGLAYSVAYPVNEFPDTVFEDRAGPALKDALTAAGVSEEDLDVCLEHDAIRYGGMETPEGVAQGKTIAGSSLWRNGGSVMSHGVVAVEPWDAEFLEQNMALRDGEKAFIQDLPSVNETGHGSEELSSALVESFTDGEHVPFEPDSSEVSRLLEEKYRNFDWISEGSETSQGHCFVVEENGEFY